MFNLSCVLNINQFEVVLVDCTLWIIYILFLWNQFNFYMYEIFVNCTVTSINIKEDLT